MSQSELTRLSVNINAETAAVMQLMRARRGLTYTEQVRRAISVYDFIMRETERGGTILVQNGEDFRELVIL